MLRPAAHQGDEERAQRLRRSTGARAAAGDASRTSSTNAGYRATGRPKIIAFRSIQNVPCSTCLPAEEPETLHDRGPTDGEPLRRRRRRAHPGERDDHGNVAHGVEDVGPPDADLRRSGRRRSTGPANAARSGSRRPPARGRRCTGRASAGAPATPGTRASTASRPRPTGTRTRTGPRPAAPGGMRSRRARRTAPPSLACAIIRNRRRSTASAIAPPTIGSTTGAASRMSARSPTIAVEPRDACRPATARPRT